MTILALVCIAIPAPRGHHGHRGPWSKREQDSVEGPKKEQNLHRMAIPASTKPPSKSAGYQAKIHGKNDFKGNLHPEEGYIYRKPNPNPEPNPKPTSKPTSKGKTSKGKTCKICK